jgi:hypothetical protein
VPDEIETRFDDVKGRDAVLGRVKETMIFLDAPEASVRRAATSRRHPPVGSPWNRQDAHGAGGGRADAKPFVSPMGAFIQMFMGVGILKVKSLYPSSADSARFGGVIVFFDEADSLGNRGQIAQGGFQNATPVRVRDPGCNGFAYLTRPPGTS